MKLTTALIMTTIVLGLSASALADPVPAGPFDLSAVACTGGAGTNGIDTGDVTGNAGGPTQCFGTFDGNDPNGSGAGLEINAGTVDSMIFDFVSRSDVNEIKDAGGSVIGVTQSIVGADIGLNIFQPGNEVDGCASNMALTGPSSTGCWSYDSSLFSAEAFIVVIKAANSPGWAAWLFSGVSATSDFGGWAVGWVANSTACTGHGGSGNCADISHLTIFAKNGTVTVPEPGTLVLLGLGLIGAGFSRRKTKK